MLDWDDGLRVLGTELFLDSRKSRDLCVISHGHSDHLGLHRRTIATPQTLAMAEQRIGVEAVTPLEFGEPHHISRDIRVTLGPAGHVLGSAMTHVETPDGTLLYTGDFKLHAGRTVEPAQTRPAEHLCLETTYAKPMFRFPPPEQVADEMVALVKQALADGRQPILLGYSLGKSQEICRICTDAGLVVTLHGAVANLAETYERFGVPVGPFRRYTAADFHGESQLDLDERGVLIAPPQVTRTAFVTRFNNPMTCMLSGWALLPGAIYRYGVEHALPLSDHADYDELLETIERVEPRKVWCHHGYVRDFCDDLRSRGIDAAPARPEAQLSLFD